MISELSSQGVDERFMMRKNGAELTVIVDGTEPPSRINSCFTDDKGIYVVAEDKLNISFFPELVCVKHRK